MWRPTLRNSSSCSALPRCLKESRASRWSGRRYAKIRRSIRNHQLNRPDEPGDAHRISPLAKRPSQPDFPPRSITLPESRLSERLFINTLRTCSLVITVLVFSLSPFAVHPPPLFFFLSESSVSFLLVLCYFVSFLIIRIVCP